MKMKSIWAVVGMVMLSILILGVPSFAQVITWKMAGVYGPGDAAFLPEKFAKDITEKSGGRLKVITYPSGQLYGSQDMFGAVQKGLVQACEIPTGYWGGPIPLYKLPDTPFVLKDNKEWKAWLDGGLWTMWQRESEKVGVKSLGMSGWNGLTCFAIYPVRVLEDAKGKKWRVYNPTTAAAVQALGGSPVTMGFPETYQALQRGVMDAAFGGVTWAYSYRWHEVAKYVTKVDFGLPPTGVFANKKAFDELPPDLKTVVVNAGLSYMNDGWPIIDQFTDAKYKAFKDEGCTVYILPDAERDRWIAKVRHIWDEEAKKIGPVGLEAMEVYYKVFPARRPK